MLNLSNAICYYVSELNAQTLNLTYVEELAKSESEYVKEVEHADDRLVVGEPDEGEEPDDPVVCIGRNKKGTDIKIAHSKVSGEHLLITPTDVADTSTSGTFIHLRT